MKKVLLSACMIALSLTGANAKGNPEELDYAGVEYNAGFEEPGIGVYSIGYQRLNDKGFGVEFTMGANYGLVDSDFAGMFFNLGPSYGYAVTDNIMVSTSLCFSGSYIGQGYKEGSKTKKEDMKFYAGVSLRPQVTFRVGKVRPHLGVTFSYSGGADKMDVGFIGGIGFSI